MAVVAASFRSVADGMWQLGLGGGGVSNDWDQNWDKARNRKEEGGGGMKRNVHFMNIGGKGWSTYLLWCGPEIPLTNDQMIVTVWGKLTPPPMFSFFTLSIYTSLFHPRTTACTGAWYLAFWGVGESIRSGGCADSVVWQPAVVCQSCWIHRLWPLYDERLCSPLNKKEQ